jgi:hypothetical protein
MTNIIDDEGIVLVFFFDLDNSFLRYYSFGPPSLASYGYPDNSTTFLNFGHTLTTISMNSTLRLVCSVIVNGMIAIA